MTVPPERIKQALRGRVSPAGVLLESVRRGWVALYRRYDRLANSSIRGDAKSAQLRIEFARMSPEELLRHFQIRSQPRFFAGFENPETIAILLQARFANDTDLLLKSAGAIVTEHRWSLLGYGEITFGEQIDWLRDPASGVRWLAEFSGDLDLGSSAGGDVRVLWELNRLPHLITLARAFAVTSDERFAEELFNQVESWKDQNPIGFGPNWSCAMEVALRAMNLLAALQLSRTARSLTEARLVMLLRLFEQHGNFIRTRLEFSYIATSNHYLSDVVGLLWLGISLPELERANEWQAFGLREVLREMDKQIFSDGADYESSTGYHRFVLELFLFTFILCRLNSIHIEDRYWQKLRLMLGYLRAYLRPDGRAPIVGDTDSGQVMPIVQHPADDHGYLLALGAVLFNDPSFKVENRAPEELLWLLGEEGLDRFAELDKSGHEYSKSACFDDAGMYVLRDRDLYLLLNASGSGLNGRGAHGHNDALSVDVSACGSNFLCDPGTFVYTGDLEQRHLFRSTHYHSTVEVDNTEQNTTDKKTPFRIGDEAQPRVLHWKTGEDQELVVAEHYGYRRLAKGEITHQRAVMFDRRERYWLIEDSLTGSGRHQFRFIFHFAPEVEATENRDVFTELHDRRTGARLLIVSLDLTEPPSFEQHWFSADYGAKVPTIAACLRIEADAPLVARWLLLPICPEEDGISRRQLISKIETTQIGNRQSAI